MTLKLICALHKALLVHRHGHFPTHTTPLHLGRLLLLAQRRKTIRAKKGLNLRNLLGYELCDTSSGSRNK